MRTKEYVAFQNVVTFSMLPRQTLRFTILLDELVAAFPEYVEKRDERLFFKASNGASELASFIYNFSHTAGIEFDLSKIEADSALADFREWWMKYARSNDYRAIFEGYTQIATPEVARVWSQAYYETRQPELLAAPEMQEGAPESPLEQADSNASGKSSSRKLKVG